MTMLNVKKDNTEWFETASNLLLSPPQSVLDSTPDAKAKQQEWLHRCLKTAAGAGAPKMAKLLLERYNEDLNHILIQYQATSLFNAAAQGHVEIVRYLLKSHNLDIHLGNRSFANGMTALHNASLNAAVKNAIASGLEDVVGTLLKHRGPVKSFDGANGAGAEKRLRSNSSKEDKKLKTREELCSWLQMKMTWARLKIYRSGGGTRG
jgi:hypothetical protein